MVLDQPRRPLRLAEVGPPMATLGQVLIKVHACAVCRTDLHVIDGELPNPKLPLIPGHEIVGTVYAKASDVDEFELGMRIGVPWLGFTCGHCSYCLTGRENLCDNARFTGYHLDGGYAQYALADHRYCFPLPDTYSDVEVAPLLCAGLIGYRSLGMCGDANTIGIYGFGAAAHIVIQVAKYQGRHVFAFTRPGDRAAQAFASDLGADWAGDSNQAPPHPMGAAIVFAPVGELVPVALAATTKGGSVVCAGIHMSDIPTFSYRLLWGERIVRSVANLTRNDGAAFLSLAPRIPIRTHVEVFPLPEANHAIAKLRSGALNGAAVLVPEWTSAVPSSSCHKDGRFNIEFAAGLVA